MATLSVQQIVEAGLEPTYSAAAEAGDTFQNDSSGRIFIHAKNGSADSITVSCEAETATQAVPGFGTMTKASISKAIGAGDDAFIGPFPITAFGTNPDLQYTEHADLTLAVLKV